MKIKGIILLAGTVFLLGGCSRKVELEDRSFVMAAGIDKWGQELSINYAFPDLPKVTEQEKEETDAEGEKEQEGILAASFYEGELKFNASSDKALDYAHLKALLFGEALLRDSGRLSPMLRYLENENIISANTLIFVCKKKAADIIKADGEIDGSLGIYLKDMYESNPYLTEEKSTTLSDFIRHWHNGQETLILPVLEVKDKKPQITSYAVLHDMEYKGDLSVEQADLLFLAKGVKADYYTQIDSYDIQIYPKQSEYSFQNSGDTPGCKARIEFEMRIANGVNLERTMLKRLKTSVEEELSEGITEVLREGQEKYGADLLNSYSLMASRDRGLWIRYRKRSEEYERTVKYHVSCRGTQL